MSMTYNLFKGYEAKTSTLVSMDEIFRQITGDQYLKYQTEQYRKTGHTPYKSGAQCFAPAARFPLDDKKQSRIEGLTGLSIVDFDHLEPSILESLRKACIDTGKAFLTYITMSGKGLRIVFRYELTEAPLKEQTKFYAEAFAYGNRFFTEVVNSGNDGERILPDPQCKNPGRLSGLAYDPLATFDPSAIPFTAEEIKAAAKAKAKAVRAEKKAMKTHMKALESVDKIYDKVVLVELTREKAKFESGRHNDFIMRMAYKMNQYGAPLESVVEWAVARFGDRYADTESVIRSCYGSRSEEHATKRKPDTETKWMTPEEIRESLLSRYDLRRNSITLSPEFRPKDSDEHFKPVENVELNTIWMDLSEEKPVSLTDIDRVMNSSRIEKYNPFLEYLESLPDWNEGEDPDYMAQLADSVMVAGGEEKQRFFEKYLKKWITWMVAAWARPNVVNHAVLVFVGEQGIYKSTWMEHLMPPELANYYIVRTNSKNINKDDMIAVAANGLICNEEIDAMRPADLDQFKALVTQTDIVERAPYARKPERRPHLASFCATGNKTKFLNDPSGNRRWLPFEVLEILSPREFPFDHEGIYSQAWALVKSGFRYWFSAEEIAEVNEHNKGYEEESLEMELIFQYFRKPGPDETGEFMTTAAIMQYIGGNIINRINKLTLGKKLKSAGFEYKIIQGVRGFILVPLTADEIQAHKKRLAV